MPTHCEFEEIAHLLVHGALPTVSELRAYKTKLKSLRGLPGNRRAPCSRGDARRSHPMDVMRTGVVGFRMRPPRTRDHDTAGARDIADRLIASFSSMLLYWYHFEPPVKRIDMETEDETIGGHFLHLLHGNPAEPRMGASHARIADSLCRT